jgi:hypothetical protein
MLGITGTGRLPDMWGANRTRRCRKPAAGTRDTGFNLSFLNVTYLTTLDGSVTYPIKLGKTIDH